MSSFADLARVKSSKRGPDLGASLMSRAYGRSFPGHSRNLFVVHCVEGRHVSMHENTPTLYINVQWFRGGLVFEAHTLLYHSV